MRNGGLIIFGVALFVLGLLLVSPIVAWLVKAAGYLTMVLGVVVFAAGVWNAARRRR